MAILGALLFIAVCLVAWLAFELAAARQERTRLRMRLDVYEPPHGDMSP